MLCDFEISRQLLKSDRSALRSRTVLWMQVWTDRQLRLRSESDGVRVRSLEVSRDLKESLGLNLLSSVPAVLLLGQVVI